ncbi:MAG: ADP-ribosylglycohydrolase family protein [Bacteroidota bacterium]
MSNVKYENVKSCFLGLAIGDALGVPVEFRSRSFLKDNPIKEMTGYGAWNQVPGTWSDDSSLTFCLAESLADGYDPDDIGKKFVAWFQTGYWGAHHKLFDVGGTTMEALSRLRNGEDPRFSGELEEGSNGNGSLMRIAPAAIYFHDLSINDFYQRIREVSAITHAHFRSVFACFLYSKYMAALFCGQDKMQAFEKSMGEVKDFAEMNEFNKEEIKRFDRLLNGKIPHDEEDSIQSFGYVMHTLEASIWCFLTTDSFYDAVLKAVNLGGDTDTTGCVTGALAGLYYGEESLPSEWTKRLAREKDIIKLAENFTDSMKKRILQ